MGKLKSNLVYNVLYQVLILIVPFITTPYVSRVLLAQGVGTYSVTTAIAKYFWMFALLGMSNYGNRSIAKVRDNKGKLSETFWNLFCFQAIVSSICLVLYIGYSLTYGYKSYGIVALCQIPYVMAALFEISWFFYGLEQFRFMVIRNIAVKVLTAVSIFVFVRTQSDVWIYVLINALSLLAGQLCLWSFLRKHIVLVKPQWKLIQSHFKPNCTLFASVVAVSIYTLMDKIMLEVMSSTVEVGYFENTEKIMMICNSIVGAIGVVMLPRISYLMESKEKGKVALYLEKSMRYIMILALGIAFGMAGIGNEFSVIFFGEDFAKCGILLMAIAPAVFFYSWENILRTQYLLPGNRDKIFVMGTVYAAVVNVLLNVLLIGKLGALGAVIGTVGAQMMAAGYQSFKVRAELPIRLYLQKLLPFTTFACLMFAVCRIIGNLLGPSIGTVVIQVVFGGAIYCIFTYVYLLMIKDDMAMTITNRILFSLRCVKIDKSMSLKKNK